MGQPIRLRLHYPLIGVAGVNYRIGRKDPEYEQAMREAKILFEAAIAKSAVKGRGRPANAPVPAAAVVVELDGDVVADEVEAVIEVPVAPVVPEVPVAEAPVPAPAKPAARSASKPASKPAAKAAKPATKPAPKSAAKTAAKGRSTTSAATATPARPATRRRPMATADQG